jgi:hypothetical protein
MTSLTIELLQLPTISGIEITEDTLSVDLSDGRTISVPLTWYPRLLHGSADERKFWRLNASSEGIHWPELDEDVSVQNLILGQASGESQRSLQRWLQERNSSPSKQ